MASDGGDDPQLRYRSVTLDALSERPPGRGPLRSLGVKVLASRTFDAELRTRGRVQKNATCIFHCSVSCDCLAYAQRLPILGTQGINQMKPKQIPLYPGSFHLVLLLLLSVGEAESQFYLP